MASLTASVALLTGLIDGVLIVYLIRQVVKRKERRRVGQGKAMARGIVHESGWLLALLAGILLMNGVLFAPWLPLESIQVEGRERTISGYVAGIQGEQMLILDKDGIPIWSNVSDIEERSVCYLKQTFRGKTLMSFIDPPENPCPEPGSANAQSWGFPHQVL
jgi:hypothetical protein